MEVAIIEDDKELVKLLLQNGTVIGDDLRSGILKLHYIYQPSNFKVGYTEIERKQDLKALNELLTHFQNSGRKLNQPLQGLLGGYLEVQQFLPEHLDFLFTHRVHIASDYLRAGSANAARWLIRHGGYPTFPSFYLFNFKERHWYHSRIAYTLEALEVLLQVGIKPSTNLKVHLGELEIPIKDYLNQGNSDDQAVDIICCNIGNLVTWCNTLKDNLQSNEHTLRKVFLGHNQQQMAHLREFSDHSLDVYPEELNMGGTLQVLNRISNMLHFLNQPHTLQWHCRVCLRESLVSLSPSVIRTLSVPAVLKRYILCHEL